MNSERFEKVRWLIIKGKVKREHSTDEADYFKVGPYDVIISDKRGVSCTCQYGSVWCFGNGGKRLPCAHVLACLASYVIKRYEDPGSSQEAH